MTQLSENGHKHAKQALEMLDDDVQEYALVYAVLALTYEVAALRTSQTEIVTLPPGPEVLR